MSRTETQSGAGWLDAAAPGEPAAPAPALVLLWSLAEPARAGEVAWLSSSPAVLGRGNPAVAFGASVGATRPLEAIGISREQLELTLRGERLEVRQLGKGTLKLDGVATTAGAVEVGQLIAVDRQALFLFTERSRHARDGTAPVPFGGADRFGIVGESPAAWALRRQLDFAAKTEAHVLLWGETGSGKELAARAVHAGSARCARALVSRNAATLPPGLIDAELFGSAKNYPNAGMAERCGLIGEADGSTLFLDELGDLPEASQVHLLRVLDRHGEYQRLGESQLRRADFRLVAATNRALSSLRSDLLARFTLRIELPSLDARREDLPLLAKHLVLRQAATNHALGERFVEGWDARRATGEPRLDPELVASLMTHTFTMGARELESILLTSISSSPGHFLARTEAVEARLKPRAPRPTRDSPPTLAEIEAVLARNGGNVSRSWAELGLSSRDALNRLLKKLRG